ncbi:MAG: galactokinase [Oscillospiraceae bacterium]|nr:galactokinase [Oscillospiraceae bacterium]
MNAAALKKKLNMGALDGQLGALYGAKTGEAVARCKKLLERFTGAYGDREHLHIFSAPGRTEIGGNHTDHNRGLALAGAVNLDTLAVAAQSPLPVIRVRSEGYEENMVMLGDLQPKRGEINASTALVRGVAAYFAGAGLPVGGFDAVTHSLVPEGSGLSSSAAFEVLVSVALDHLYGTGALKGSDIAPAGRYAENVFFGKPSGLMDQTASAEGGLLEIDFAHGLAAARPIACDFGSYGHAIYIVGPLGSHAELTGEYAQIAEEMRLCAKALGKEYLREAQSADFYAALPSLRAKLPGRALLRAMHFYAENERVPKQARALETGKFDEFLALVNESGRSSFMYLQNVYTPGEQSLALALALSEKLLGGAGAARVHGGGFAGTIQAFVPSEAARRYKAGMEQVFGEGSCHAVRLREQGGVKIV